MITITAIICPQCGHEAEGSQEAREIVCTSCKKHFFVKPQMGYEYFSMRPVKAKSPQKSRKARKPQITQARGYDKPRALNQELRIRLDNYMANKELNRAQLAKMLAIELADTNAALDGEPISKAIYDTITRWFDRVHPAGALLTLNTALAKKYKNMLPLGPYYNIVIAEFEAGNVALAEQMFEAQDYDLAKIIRDKAVRP